MLDLNKLALVVGSSDSHCVMVSVLLNEEGYKVEVANDGVEGVEKYIKHQPDLVLMDIHLPVMDGYEAARRIKNISGNNLAPLIFITSINSDKTYIDCIDAGGDEMLISPFSPQVFKAKIKSIQRINDLSQQIKKLQQAQHHDAQLAEKMITEVVESRNFASDKIGSIKQAAAMFSGDIQLSSLCPNGDIHILLGDFTGHGLRASIGAIPITETFRAMTAKGFGLIDIISQVNKQLYTLLPSDLFFAACFVRISEHEQMAYVFNAGLPDGYIFNKQCFIRNQFPSIHPPLGILPTLLNDIHVKAISIEATDHLVLISDGLIEARNEQGNEFGISRFEQAAKEGLNNNDIADTVLRYLHVFCQCMPQEDDISLIDVPCYGWRAEQLPTQHVLTKGYALEDGIYNATPTWSWQLHLADKPLATVNPIPLIMNQINDIEGSGEHWQSLYTVLTELFVNALDHGVLGLDSALKNSGEGFAQYYNERAKRLENLTQGFVRIDLSYFPFAQGGRMLISIKDSGDGFNVQSKLSETRVEQTPDTIQLSGRGIDLIKQLCDSLEYQENGSSVVASYIWNNV